jgi:hypothetical protein
MAGRGSGSRRIMSDDMQRKVDNLGHRLVGLLLRFGAENGVRPMDTANPLDAHEMGLLAAQALIVSWPNRDHATAFACGLAYAIGGAIGGADIGSQDQLKAAIVAEIESGQASFIAAAAGGAPNA